MQTNERQQILNDLEILRRTGQGFEALALRIFRYQAAHNPLYRRYLSLLHRPPESVQHWKNIPFLPISLFKTHSIQTGAWTPEVVFTSSSTTGQTPSRHLTRDLDAYLTNTLAGFRQYYGDPADWMILALLPAYLERKGSSLVAMADFFIRRSRYPQSGFFLHDLDALAAVLQQRPERVPVLLLGVSFALLDLAGQFPMPLPGVTIMETGGMKGRRREMTRQEMHGILQQAFQVPVIHSEYGMTELLSQAYSQGNSIFTPANTMQVMAVELNDPFCAALPGRNGVLQVADLANVDTCSFIATEDLGKVYANGSFEVTGRADTAEMRGCNLMVE